MCLLFALGPVRTCLCIVSECRGTQTGSHISNQHRRRRQKLTRRIFRAFSPGYIGEFEVIDDHRSGKIVVQLLGRVNKAGCISPRYNVPIGNIENLVAQLLPARSFGYVVLTTSAGIMDHEEARRKHVGGKVLSFFY